MLFLTKSRVSQSVSCHPWPDNKRSQIFQMQCAVKTVSEAVPRAICFSAHVENSHLANFWSWLSAVWEVKGGRASLVPLSSRSTQGMAPFWEASPVACEKNARKSPVVIQAAQRRAIYLFGIIRPHNRFGGKFEAWCLPPYPISLGCILLQRARTLRYEWKPLSLYYLKRLNIF